jgi:endo-1,4-beta-xylanase
MPSPTRRSLLAGATGLVFCGAASPSRPATHTPDAPGEPGLQSRAARRGLFFGSAIDNGLLETDAAYMAHVPTECGAVVSEAAFKWADIHPTADGFSFDRADKLMAYAKRHALRVRGHALLWHEANPAWLEQTITPANAEALLTRHIATVAGHFSGRLMHWDVANEVVYPEDNGPLGLRNTLWLRALGPRYLDIAFHATAAADPAALRVLNEYGTDYAIASDERKRAALLGVLADLKSRNVPIQAVGLQAHLDASQIALDQGVLAKFVGDIAAMGLKVIVTELDVRDNGLPADTQSRDDAVAAHARAWLDPVLANGAVLGVLTWGLSDRRTWLNEKFPRADKLPQRALPLDTDLRRKKLWASIGAALDAAPARGTPL